MVSAPFKIPLRVQNKNGQYNIEVRDSARTRYVLPVRDELRVPQDGQSPWDAAAGATAASRRTLEPCVCHTDTPKVKTEHQKIEKVKNQNSGLKICLLRNC